MPRVAIAVWNKRISPVFDVSRKIYVCDIEADGVTQQAEKLLPEENPVQRAACLRDLGVDTLICGAISRPLAEMLSACKIHLLPFTTGDVQTVLDAFIRDRLPHADFSMPGCCRRHQARSGGSGRDGAGPRGRGVCRGNAVRGHQARGRPMPGRQKGGYNAQR